MSYDLFSLRLFSDAFSLLKVGLFCFRIEQLYNCIIFGSPCKCTHFLMTQKKKPLIISIESFKNSTLLHAPCDSVELFADFGKQFDEKCLGWCWRFMPGIHAKGAGIFQSAIIKYPLMIFIMV